MMHIFVIKARKFVGEEKEQDNIESVSELYYRQYNCRIIKIENNNGGGVYAE